MSSNNAEEAWLITLTARTDPAFEGTLFVSLRRYDLAADAGPLVDAMEVASAGEAVDVVRRWLEAMVDD